MSYCEICELGDLGREVHNSVIHRLADRIAKLEARMDDKCGLCGGPNGRSSEHVCRRSPTFDQLVAKAGPLASTGLASAESPPAAAGPIPPGYKLAPGWSTVVPHTVIGGPLACIAESCYADSVYYGRNGVCAAHAVEKGALVKVEPSVQWACGCGYTNAGPVCTKCGKPPAPSQVRCNNESFCPAMTDHPSGACPAHRFSLPAPAQGAPCDRCGGRPRYGDSNVCKPCATGELAQGAPAEPLSDAMTCSGCKGVNGNHEIFCETLAADLLRSLNKPGVYAIHKACAPIVRKVAALEALLAETERKCLGADQAADTANKALAYYKDKLAAAERERSHFRSLWLAVDEAMKQAILEREVAVAAERERCLSWAQAEHLVIPGGMSMEKIRDAIRNGRPAPK